ncbi:MAG TPA: hypothetical protein VN847_20295, partial [Streptosporangiaceae bacterium]|nr:hypothetical protein [Streptosporangiaceae bacterium]
MTSDSYEKLPNIPGITVTKRYELMAIRRARRQFGGSSAAGSAGYSRPPDQHQGAVVVAADVPLEGGHQLF